MEAVTEQLRGVGRQFGGQAELFGAAAQYSMRWLSVPGSDVVKARLGAALAELYTEAGWSCYDAGVDGMGCFVRALRLADEAGDGFGIANAAFHAGLTLVRSGHPNDALKCFQLEQFVLTGFHPGKLRPMILRADDLRVPVLAGRLNRNAFEQAGADFTTAKIQLDLGRLDTAEAFAASAVRTYGDTHGRGRTSAELALAEVHVRTGSPAGWCWPGRPLTR